MSRHSKVLTSLIVLGAAAAAAEDPRLASAADLASLLAATVQDVSGADGHWTALYRGTRIVVHAIEQHDRMRIMAPIASAGDLDPAELAVLLEANFARALDAKFAIGDGVVWSLFNHRLAGLGHAEFLDGLEQVVTLKRNFGTSYRSTELTFGRLPGEEGR